LNQPSPFKSWEEAQAYLERMATAVATLKDHINALASEDPTRAALIENELAACYAHLAVGGILCASVMPLGPRPDLMQMREDLLAFGL